MQLTNGIDVVTEKSGIKRKIEDAGTNSGVKSSEKCTNIDLDMLEKNVESYVDEFNRKIELQRYLKIIINKRGFDTHALPENMKEALKTYKLYGKNMEMDEIKWMGWQHNLGEYLDEPCNRKIIWVVCNEENDDEIKLFQRNVCEEFGYSRVCKIPYGEDARNTFLIIVKEYLTNTDIFLFNVRNYEYKYTEQYEILEKMTDGLVTSPKYEDGWAISPKYDGPNL